jgi:hypothetical protein
MFALLSTLVFLSRTGGQGRGRTADLPLFRRIHSVAARGWTRPDGRSSWGNHGSLSPDVAWRLPALPSPFGSPISLAPLTSGNAGRLTNRGAAHAG